ncbi:LLM class flavin-dependent oxidoreductase [Amycolatopsis minnesotensis]|uniref:LLM class flavin-dependent oxidoreductase n=1 Tax=Amycolatopsis minnesotensis TaxID=337894 RepID=A0ABP5CSZ6_9PSEU
MTVDIGLFLPYLGDATSKQNLAEAARFAEETGLDTLWTGDNLSMGSTPIIDATLALATAAAVTERIELGLGVLLPALRGAEWAAKQIGGLQHLSGNRLLLGVGLGGGDEFKALGITDRGRRTDEFLEALPSLLSGEAPLKLAPAVPVPPVWIGGSSTAALRRTARFGDGWLADWITPGELRVHGETLRELAAEHGRPAPALAAVVTGEVLSGQDSREDALHRFADLFGFRPADIRDQFVTGSTAQVAEKLAEFAEAGAGKIAFISGGDWRATCANLGEIRALLT